MPRFAIYRTLDADGKPRIIASATPISTPPAEPSGLRLQRCVLELAESEILTPSVRVADDEPLHDWRDYDGPLPAAAEFSKIEVLDLYEGDEEEN